jgi:catechol 2,3-dioxygenase-like lactoylglutathione lyase family enzyme
VLGSADVMAFVATRDPVAARTFYAETLGLRLVADDQFALVFDANGTELRVQKVPEPAPLSSDENLLSLTQFRDRARPQ